MLILNLIQMLRRVWNRLAPIWARERRIPFEVSADPFYSESNMRYLEGIARDIREGKAHFEEHELIED